MKNKKELSESISKGKQSEKELLASSLNNPVSKEMVEIQWENAGKKEKSAQDTATQEKTWQDIRARIQNSESKRSTNKRSWKPFLRIAASIVLIAGSFLLGSLISNGRFRPITAVTDSQSLENPAKVRSEIVLPDNSVVSLGPSSEITYDKGFGKDNRSISLSGKARFKVSPNQDLLFVVTSSYVSVEAKGTEFIISENQEITLTTLLEGSVIVKTNDASQELKPEVNKTMVFSENTLKEERALSEGDVSWTRGVLSFESVSLGYLCRELEAWYGVEIILPEDLENKYEFKLKVQDETFDELINVLCLAAPLNIIPSDTNKYTVEENNNN